MPRYTRRRALECATERLATARLKENGYIAVEFDDEENQVGDCSELALVVEIALLRAGFTGLDVTVYSNPEALAMDAAEGYGIFAAGREDDAEPLPLAEASAPSA